MIKAVFWDFGGVITSSPFESFNRFEKENDLPKDFLRSVNSTNPDFNAWAKLERNEVNLEQFDELFEIESKNLGHAVKGKDVIALLRGQIRPEMIVTLKKIKDNLVQACLDTNVSRVVALSTDKAAAPVVRDAARGEEEESGQLGHHAASQQVFQALR